MKGKSIREKIKEYFFVNPNAKLRVREIERKLNCPLPSVIRYCKELASEGILIIMSIGNSNFYTADKVSKVYLLEKKLYNLKSLYLSGIIEYVKEKASNPVIILFGSYSRGEDNEESDIDLYVETKSKISFNFNKFEKLLNRKIQVFLYKGIKRITNPHLANNIINGITLNNFIEVFK